MFRQSHRISLLFVSSMLCFGCHEKRPGNWKETVPVAGRILVDGEPAAMLPVSCVDLGPLDKKRPTITSGMTDEDGDFDLGTYVAGDGVPEGDYVLTFQWGTLNLFRHTYEGDKLNGRYSDAKTSQVKFKAKIGEPVDLGEIELTTK